ncbi:MAG: phosphoglucomutase, alpha-D-glucose phosphate-specific [Armatimonadetes bacterium]|nr:phosphoglucomutase, alpha-D-glucose phosphate-specific [Armatimonadota bacterium]MDE2205236.1 phosphoglucomutase, alpha-D-glucose phosphate-specific [Armatimonadota bacterium]
MGPSQIIDVPAILADFCDIAPDPGNPAQRVSFGTSGHRGRSSDGSFNEAHIAAICQAICERRSQLGINGPLFLGMDTHALSRNAHNVALEVLAGNRVTVCLSRAEGAAAYTPTPAVSRAIISENSRAGKPHADGIVITPSHNPPTDGGIKYNPPVGGPADTATTGWIETRANELLSTWRRDVRRIPLERALDADRTVAFDFLTPYVDGLALAIDTGAIARSQIRIGVDPLGGASTAWWPEIANRYRLNLEVLATAIDPSFSFIPPDYDGVIRMDCSSPPVVANLVSHRNEFRIAFACDPDADRHGIVTPTAGLLDPNGYLAAMVHYLLHHREKWPAGARAAKTIVTSSLVDRAVEAAGRKVCETPVGFKWFADGLLNGTIAFGGEESAGASFLCLDGAPWTTDKDGIVACMLAAEITAVTGHDPGEWIERLHGELGRPWYRRVNAPATLKQQEALRNLTPEAVSADTLAGEPVLQRLTTAPCNDAPIGGLKVSGSAGWFVARPSGTEPIYKIYAESFRDEATVDAILHEAQQIVTDTLSNT